MSRTDPTFLGSVAAVSGSTVTVNLADSLASGLAIIGGQAYRVGQVGSFVRIPLGYQDLYGVIVEVGASAGGGDDIAQLATRWMKVELAGETIGDRFERGLSQHPNIGDAVHLVVERDLIRIYGGVGDDQIAIGTLASADNISVRLSLNSLVTRHSAVLGSTGSGKSTTVASLLRSIVAPEVGGGSLGARIVLLDLHGEYARALEGHSRIFSVTPSDDQESLVVPFWALLAEDLLDLVCGPMSEGHAVVFLDKILDLKRERLAASPISGVDQSSVTVDTPIPFSLNRMWYDLIDVELATFSGPQRETRELETHGDAEKLIPPKYRPHRMGAAGPFLNPELKGIRRPLELLRSRLLDRRYDFVSRPGPWRPDTSGKSSADLDTLLGGWLGSDRPITILDLSGVPSAVLVRLIGSILRIIYEALYWGREKTEGGVLRPLLLVMEEAHRYLADGGNNPAAEIVKRIAKEGRKYGVGAMLVSQRPTEIDETVLAQCGTFVAMRLSNPNDRARVQGALPDSLSGLIDLLPVLRTGEAIVVGEASRLPVRCRVTPPPSDRLPRSIDPNVSAAWATKRIAEGYDRVVAAWRAQRVAAEPLPPSVTREKVKDEEA